MARDKSRDNTYFYCSRPKEMHYVAGLYKRKNSVLDYLIKNCQDGSINYLTFLEIYQLIQRDLGFPIPE
jgi:hypothetical protein